MHRYFVIIFEYPWCNLLMNTIQRVSRHPSFIYFFTRNRNLAFCSIYIFGMIKCLYLCNMAVNTLSPDDIPMRHRSLPHLVASLSFEYAIVKTGLSLFHVRVPIRCWKQRWTIFDWASGKKVRDIYNKTRKIILKNKWCQFRTMKAGHILVY